MQKTDSLVIRLYGDSITQPRYTEGVNAVGTFLEQLKDMLEEKFGNLRVVNYSKGIGGAPITDFQDIVSIDSYYFNKSVIIFLFGIVDCAPRPIPKKLRKIISIFPNLLKSKIIKFLHNKRTDIQALKYYQYTPPEKFRKVYEKMIHVSLAKEESKNNKIYLINIAPAKKLMLENNPQITECIEEYNKIIKEIAESNNVGLIDVNSVLSNLSEAEVEAVYGSDGHHFTPKGQKIYADLIFQELMKEPEAVKELYE